jgi:hypothetical protein
VSAERTGVVHRATQLLCVPYAGEFWREGIDLVGEYVEKNHRTELIGPITIRKRVTNTTYA